MSLANLTNTFPDVASFIHQAALGQHLSDKLLNEVCNGCIKFNISGLCTSLVQLAKTKELLGQKNQTKLIAVVAFPFGNIPQEFKISEAEWAANQGAEELDIVPNFIALHQGKVNIFAEELAQLCELGLPVRSIIDINNLTKEKLYLAVEASLDAGVEGIQIGNGFGNPVSKEQVKEVSKLVNDRSKIKAVGGIKNISHAIELIEAGATHLGTSFGLDLLQKVQAKNKV